MKNIKKPKKQQVPPFKGRTLAKLEVRPRASEFPGKLSQVSQWKLRQASPHYFPDQEHAHLWDGKEETTMSPSLSMQSWGKHGMPLDTLWAGGLDDTLGGTRELSFFLIKWKRMRRREWKDRWHGIMGNAKEMYSPFYQQVKWDKTSQEKSCKDHHLTEIQNSGVRLLSIKICVQGCTRCSEFHSSHRPHPFELASHVGLWGWALATFAALMTT